MRALVTGCAGFIGSHLSESLLADGNEVIGLDCFNDNYNAELKWRNLSVAMDSGGFRLVPIDIARGGLEEFTKDVDVIFHLAGEPGVRASWGDRFDTYLRNNLLATQQLLEAARVSGLPRFVYASSSSVYGAAESYPTGERVLPQPHSPYGVTKMAAEHLAFTYFRNWNLPVVALRYFSVYGPRQRPDMAFTRFCKAALAREPLEVYGDGTQIRDFTFVADIIAATRSAATAHGVEGKVYNVGGGSEISLNAAIECLGQLAGFELTVNRTETQRGDVHQTGAEISAARSDLDFSPATSVREGLKKQLQWAATAAS